MLSRRVIAGKLLATRGKLFSQLRHFSVESVPCCFWSRWKPLAHATHLRPTRDQAIRLLKTTARHVASLLAFIIFGLGLSWGAVYGFWFAPQLFHSVRAVRACEWLGSVILIPVRILFWLISDTFDQTTPLTDPLFYSAVNGVLLGIIGHGICRRWLLPTRPRAGSARQTRSGSPP